MSEEIDNLREALKHSPDNVPLRLYLADMLIRAGRNEDAESEYKAALQSDPNHLKAKIGLAKLYLRLQNFSAAIVILEDLAGMYPNDADVLINYARALLREGSIGQARDVYQDLLATRPDLRDEELDNVLRRGAAAGQGELEDDDTVDEDALRMLEKPDVTFADVGGMDKVKEEIELKIIRPLQHPELYKAYGKKIGGGILLYGPPGCGKTHLARATAGQVDAKFINIGINDVLDMWIGQSEKNLHEIFETARRNAPCVLFFDEIDALGASRSDMRQSSGRHLINQFLSELDGVQSNNDGVLILGATNAPWHLDTAFRRPGRFDRIIFVSPPDEPAKAGILDILLRDKPTANVDYAGVAKKTNEFSGADLQAVVDIAIEQKLQEAFKSGIPEPIGTKDLLKAAKKHKTSTRDWFNSARNYALYANDSGLYDDILTYLNIKR